MVVEHLTFPVAPHELAAWLDADERTWTAFLSRQPGFVGKQVWIERGTSDLVHAVIVWHDDASWRSVSTAEAAAVDAAMGDLLRPATLRTFEVVRRT